LIGFIEEIPILNSEKGVKDGKQYANVSLPERRIPEPNPGQSAL
jgi:hypothetical protein